MTAAAALATAGSSRRPRILTAIAGAGLTAGVFDFTIACVESGKPPLFIGGLANAWLRRRASTT